MDDVKQKNPDAVALGRLGGLARSIKKRKSSRQNLLIARSALGIETPLSSLPSRRKINGRYQYEISPGRWVSAQRVYQLRYPREARARGAARFLDKKACEKCGDQKTEAHHEDYEKPLEVQWLCKQHHVEADKARRKRLSQ